MGHRNKIGADMDSHVHCAITITSTLHAIADGGFPEHERTKLGMGFWRSAFQHTDLNNRRNEFARAMGCEPPHLLRVLANQKSTHAFMKPLRELGFGTQG